MNTHDSEWRAVVEKFFDRVWELLNPKGDPDEEDWKDWEEPAQVFAAIDRALSDGRLTLIDKEIHHIDGDPRNNALIIRLSVKGVKYIVPKSNTEMTGTNQDAQDKRNAAFRTQLADLRLRNKLMVKWITAVEKRLIKLERKAGA